MNRHNLPLAAAEPDLPARQREIRAPERGASSEAPWPKGVRA